MTEEKTPMVMKLRPFTDINYHEALRRAAGVRECSVSVLLFGEGVYAGLKDADRYTTNM